MVVSASQFAAPSCHTTLRLHAVEWYFIDPLCPRALSNCFALDLWTFSVTKQRFILESHRHSPVYQVGKVGVDGISMDCGKHRLPCRLLCPIWVGESPRWSPRWLVVYHQQATYCSIQASDCSCRHRRRVHLQVVPPCVHPVSRRGSGWSRASCNSEQLCANLGAGCQSFS